VPEEVAVMLELGSCEDRVSDQRTYGGDFSAVTTLLLSEVKLRLDSKPEVRTIAKVAGKPQSRIGGNTALATNDLAYPSRRKVGFLCETVRADVEGLEEFLQQYLAGMYVG